MTVSASTTPSVEAFGAPAGIAAEAMELARVFAAGGRLVVAAPARHDHARHVAVEFVHPAITGARALPAMATGVEDLPAMVTARDAVLIIAPPDGVETVSVPAARLVLRVGGRERPLSGSGLVRWYHLLWELVQLGLEHPGITGGSAAAGGDATDFLYPFLDAAESDSGALLADLTTSATAKLTESDELSRRTVDDNANSLDNAAADLAQRAAAGGTVFAIGNGGSACDAARLVRLLTAKGVRAVSLADDPAVLTALANDLGADMIFSRQVEAALTPLDALVAFSTSGASANLLAAFDVPAADEATVVACAGYEGGAMCRHRRVDHCLVVASTSVHRIQEAQGALIDELCHRLQPVHDRDQGLTP